MRKLGSVDLDTGEILPHNLVAMQRKAPSPFTVRDERGFVAMAQTALEMIAGCDQLQGNDLRVFLAVVARLDFENLVLIEQKEIAEKLKMQKTHVSRSLKRLVDLGILVEGQKIGRSKRYQLNPNYGWKGSTENHHKALRVQEKARAAGFKVHKGGKADDDAAMRAKMEAEGQSRLFD